MDRVLVEMHQRNQEMQAEWMDRYQKNRKMQVEQMERLQKSQKVQTEQVETLQKSQIHRIRQNSRCRKNQVVSRQPMEKRQRNKTRIIPIVRRVRTQVNRRQILRIMHHREAMEMHQVVWVVQRSSL